MSSVCLSVCLSVRPSVMLVDQDHTGWKSWKLVARSSKAIQLLPGDHGEIPGRLEVGWEKVACWSTKAAISQKHVKIEEKLLWRAYRYSQTLFWTVPSPTSYGLPFPKIGGSQPQPKTAIAIISGTGKAADCKFGRYIHRVHPNKSPWKIWEKRERGRIEGLPKFWSTQGLSVVTTFLLFKVYDIIWYDIWNNVDRHTFHTSLRRSRSSTALAIQESKELLLFVLILSFVAEKNRRNIFCENNEPHTENMSHAIY